MTPRGILYSFRRCPYAIRARLALAETHGAVTVREVALKAKPPELLDASAKGTVPVLVHPDGAVLEESQAILFWALAQSGEHRGMGEALRAEPAASLIAACDGPFKRHLDGFRYGGSARSEHRGAALAILRRWNATLAALEPASGPPAPWLEPLGWAVLPFVRQFRRSDGEEFAQEPNLEWLKRWLTTFEEGPALARVMDAPWAWREPWRSPRWLYHLALEPEWQEARQQGVYTRSTRGKSLQEVGFLHASWSHQVEATWQRFYGDGPELRLLVIDPARLAAVGIPVHEEPAPGSGEGFPHIYGALPMEAVLLAQRYAPNGDSAMAAS
jgi:glutathione S-transferase